MGKIRYHIKMLGINNKLRPITLYTRRDIRKQKELYSRYAQFFMEHTHPSVYSFVTGFSNFDAAFTACRYAEGFHYYIKIDIHEYYPSIQRDLLLDILLDILPEKDTQKICRYVFCCPTGISEGSPLSPAMSNIYLRNFDEEMSILPDTFYTRYCDDILLLSNIEPASIYPRIENALLDFGLTVSPDKLRIGYVADGVYFLGYVIKDGGITVQPEKVSEIIEKLNSEPNHKKRERIANGFKAYYRNPLFLPICQASIMYLDEFGSNKEKQVYNDLLDAVQRVPPKNSC